MRGPVGTPVGELRRIQINNVIIYNTDANYSCTISGTPGHDIQDIELNNIKLYVRGDSTAYDNNTSLPENENKYPEPGMFGKAPAYGFFIRHAKNIRISDVEIKMLGTDSRPVIRAYDVKDLVFRHVNSPGMTTANKAIFKEVSDLRVQESFENK